MEGGGGGGGGGRGGEGGGSRGEVKVSGMACGGGNSVYLPVCVSWGGGEG